jgi:hypothetical protein
MKSGDLAIIALKHGVNAWSDVQRPQFVGGLSQNEFVIYLKLTECGYRINVISKFGTCFVSRGSIQIL